jgi:hypothetical protein
MLGGQHAAAADTDGGSGTYPRVIPTLDARYRLESVDQADKPSDALASTLRLRLGYAAALSREWQGGLVLEDVHRIGPDNYNDTANGQTDRPVVADRQDTELDQAWIGFTGFGDTTVAAGRQVVALANQRFVGNVGFRQNEQTFDGLTVRSSAGPVNGFFAHLSRANRIFGAHHPDVSKARTDMKTDLLHLDWRLPGVTLSPYAYFIDNRDAPATSHRDLGLRVAGKRAGGAGVDYVAEYARQQHYRDGDQAIDVGYADLEFGWHGLGAAWRVGYEKLGGNGRYGFATPLATLHAFQGWADRFLATPADGIRDAWLRVGGRAAGFAWTAVAHDFRADRGSSHYGRELDLALGHGLGQHYSARLEAAEYRADAHATNTRILWLTLQANY